MEVWVSATSLEAQFSETFISTLVSESAKVCMPAATMLVESLRTQFHKCN